MDLGKITAPLLQARKQTGPRITSLTAYDYPTARVIDAAGIDVVLVGDSLGMVVQGADSTLEVTLEDMIYHTRIVRRGTSRALVVADLPFGSYHPSIAEGVRSAVRLVKEGRAEAVKIEGGQKRARLIRSIIESEIPVMGHIGLTPQSLHVFGGYKVQGKSRKAIQQLLDDAAALVDAGVFSIVLECIPTEVARRITRAVTVPTIGIGAGPDCDGQVLVLHDMLGLAPAQHRPKFVRSYANLEEVIDKAVRRYVEDVQQGSYPTASESYHLPVAVTGKKGLQRS